MIYHLTIEGARVSNFGTAWNEVVNAWSREVESEIKEIIFVCAKNRTNGASSGRRSLLPWNNLLNSFEISFISVFEIFSCDLICPPPFIQPDGHAII